MRTASLLVCCCSYIALSAQTKKIAYKSHSGNMAYYEMAVEEHLFNMDHSNFGVGIERDVKTASLDSVIFVSKEVAVMVTSDYCKPRTAPADQQAKLWRAGKDTVYNHPLFSRQHALDSIRQQLKRYYFRNDLGKTVFIGYDNIRPDTCMNNQDQFTLPLPVTNDQGGPGNAGLVWLAGSIVLFSFLIALVSQRKSKWRIA